jgi:uncharacterized damage-inducible protein DinB
VEAYEYLASARARLFDWVARLTRDEYVREFPVGHGSVRSTLVHVAAAEWGYVRRLQGEAVPPLEERPFFRYLAEPFPPLREAWEAQAQETRRVLQEARDGSRPVEYVSTFGGRRRRFRTTAAGLVTQLLVHEVHHRAQVMLMLRQLGQPAQNLDYSALRFEVEELEP